MASERVAEAARRPPLRTRLPFASLSGTLIAVALVLIPLTFVAVEALSAGLSEVRHVLLRPVVGELLLHTVLLAAACTALCAVLGVGCAWLVARTNLPARRLWAVLLVLPLGIPDFVVAFGWVSLDHSLHGYLPTVLILTLSLYPLVYLPVVTALSSVDGSLEEAARSLGLGPWRTFRSVTLRQVRVAVLGGCLLVTLGLLAEYGAFEILQFRTFTVEIFTQYKLAYDGVAAAVLSLVLLVITIAVLAGELALTGGRPATRSGRGARRPAARVPLGRRTVPALAAVVIVCAAALGVPVSSVVYWTLRGGNTTLPGASLPEALGYTAAYSAAAAAIATVLAVAVATLALRHRGRVSLLLERVTYLPLALPGLVVALGFVAFSVRYTSSAFLSSPIELILAYAVLFLPLAVVAVRSSLAGAPARLEEVARSLGVSPARAWARVTLPAILPGVAAAFAFVFISAATELTATLVLRPTGVDTLATRFWEYTSGFAYGSAAPYALVMILISAVPAYVLSTRFGLRSTGRIR
ncbi:MAG TPA: iron ABC transporter permease [Solirubrobacteraceae bacterium]|nr:iron ABC transporter permease [Solirubrobacteraceae bacterium]